MPQSLQRPWNRYIMTKCDGPQQMKKTRTVPKSLLKSSTISWSYYPMSKNLTDLPMQRHLYQIWLFIPYTFWKFTTVHALKSDYRLFTPITEPTVVSNQLMSSWSHIYFHVVKLSRPKTRWNVASLDVYCSIRIASWPHLLVFPMIHLSFGLPIFHTPLRNARLFPWTDVRNLVKLIRHNGWTYVLLNWYDKRAWPTLRL